MFLIRILALIAILAAFADPALAHVVPSMTVEMDFARNRGFTMKVNFDPRLFLSDRPTELPAVPADWYRDQSQEEKEKTHAQARDYLHKNLNLLFGTDSAALPELKIEPIDGADNQLLKEETAEMHLLATGRAVIPAAAKDFRLQLGRDANVSMILLNHLEGRKETVPGVVFAGETSQPFDLAGVLPTMIVEMNFTRTRGFTMKVTFDPRLFSDSLSGQSSASADWYRNQSQEEKEKTHSQAREYLNKNLKLLFGIETGELPPFKIEPLDAADNRPLKKETQAILLRAAGSTAIPPTAKDFRLELSGAAAVGTVLLNHMEGQKETRSGMVAPGETGQFFELTGVLSMAEALAALEKGRESKPAVSIPWIMRGIISLFLIVFWAFFLKKRRSAGPPPRKHMH